jgi:ABC-type branched-subunit amino acid transport system ATPase component
MNALAPLAIFHNSVILTFDNIAVGRNKTGHATLIRSILKQCGPVAGTIQSRLRICYEFV